MRLQTATLLTLLMIAAAGGCASTPAARPAAAPSSEAPVGTTAELENAYTRHRVAGLDARRFLPEDYWEVTARLLADDTDRFRIEQIGSSVERRPLRRVDFGDGDISVLLWSQMHGDESTASRALLDVFDYLLRNPDDPRVRGIESALAVTFVPVLNPDGAARFVRHNAVGIDLNRDARALATPEGRALKAVRDDVDADWGFNLHDQNIRTRRGSGDEGVQISLLAPPPGDGTTNEANENAKQLAALIVHALRPVVGESIARYSETFNPRAFGDLMTQWGTATVLIESGGALDDPGKELPRRANFVAVLSALDAIATGAWRRYPQDAYAELPPNGRAVNDLLIFGAEIVLPGGQPVRADVAVRYADSLDRSGGVVAEVGDLEGAEALQTIDADGLYLVLRFDGDRERMPALLPGDTLDGVLSRDRDGRQVVWRLDAGRPIRVGSR
jgi:hypothetical protein